MRDAVAGDDVQDLTQLGFLAYQEYGRHRDWAAYDGSPIPAWSLLDPGIQRAWIRAAGAVATAVRAALLAEPRDLGRAADQ